MPVTDPVEALMRELKPERFLHQSREAIERDHLHIVEHHQKYLIPHLRRYITPDVQTVLDFGCGSGGSTIALALEFPGLEIIGTDVEDRKSTRLNSSHPSISYAVFCLKKKKITKILNRISAHQHSAAAAVNFAFVCTDLRERLHGPTIVIRHTLPLSRVACRDTASLLR